MSSILITGASKGIGRATAVELAKRGHRVVATARDPRTLDGLDVDQRLRLDVTDQASVDAAVEQARRDRHPRLELRRHLRRSCRGQPDRRDRAPLLPEHRRGDPRDPGPPAPDAPRQKAGCCSSPASPGESQRLAPPPTHPRSGRSRPSRRRWPSRLPGFGIDVTLAEPGHHSRSRAVLRSRNQHFEMVGSVGHDRHWRRALVVSWRRRGLQQASG